MVDHWLLRWLKRFCDPILWEGIQGDLHELYAYEVDILGTKKAKRRMIRRSIGFFRPAFYHKQTQLKNSIESMLRNNLLITIRNLRKHKGYSAINLLGLAIGMAAGFLILQHVAFELSYDDFHTSKENIYRMRLDRTNGGEIRSQWASGAAGVGPDITADFPEVKRYTRLTKSYADISYDQEYYQVDDPYYASEDFFSIFSIPLISGVDSLVLRDPYTVVLSQSLAEKIFKDEDPIGKEIKMGDRNDMIVTGVFQDLPENSHMTFDLLYSFETYIKLTSNDAVDAWDHDGFLTYIELFPGTDAMALEAKLPQWVADTHGEELAEYDEFMTFYLQPIDDIHLISNYRGEIKPTGNKSATYFLAIVGLFVLVIAWINYINLTTARSLQRAKEVGIRKTLGSVRGQLIGQFIFESSFLNLIALAIAIIMVLYFFPYFNAFAGKSVAYTWPVQPEFWLGLGGIFLAGIALSGFYPAVVMSGFKPLVVLRGSFARSKSGNRLRQGLVVVQFFASIVLITGTFIVYQQMDFLRDQDLGVKIDQTLVIETPNFQSDSVYASRYSVFENLIENESFVKNITESTATPGNTPEWNAGGIRLLTQSEQESSQYRIMGMDADFIGFYGLDIVAGRAFDESYGTEEENVIMSERAVKLAGINSPEEIIGQKLFFWGDTFNIVGVVKDYRQESPKAEYDALIFRYFEHPGGFYSIELSGNDMQNIISTIEGHWTQAYTNKPFEYYFLDDHYNEQYKSEVRFGSIFGLFAGLAIFVACLGLFGLASFMTSMRLKEVSIRKVLGAANDKLWLLLTIDFLKLVGVSIVLSFPLTYYLMGEWLGNFATRIGLNVWLFLIPALILALIAVTTVSYHTFRVIFSNPSDSLKCE
ncbi:MAG: ABC transporter permease [Cyclobacteriaceae bacterium]